MSAAGWAGLFWILHGALLLGVTLSAVHRLRLIGWSMGRDAPQPALDPSDRPGVTVQIPLFNERFVAERVIRAVAALDWPREALEIQVLDDSTDETRVIVDRVAAELVAEGVGVVVLRRGDRQGFKAGALGEGLRVARFDRIALFDADFIPDPGWLKAVVGSLGPGVACVQSRWGHLNPLENRWTLAQSILLDGHFLVQQPGRARGGAWFNFNGTAAIWRREAILAAGGWEGDTLTEDLDLSYRAWLSGQRLVYLPDVVVEAELPASASAFRAQQRRWSRGTIQTARKLLPAILRSGAPWRVRSEAVLHLLGPVVFPAGLALSLGIPAAWGAALASPGWGRVLANLDGGLLALTLGSHALFHGLAVWRSGKDVGWRILALPWALAVGVSLSWVGTRAAAAGLRDGGEFVRTPKQGSRAGGGYGSVAESGLGELALAAWHLGAAIAFVAVGLERSALVFGWFALGYGAMGAAVVREWLQAARRSPAPQEGTQSQGDSTQRPSGPRVERTR